MAEIDGAVKAQNLVPGASFILASLVDYDDESRFIAPSHITKVNTECKRTAPPGRIGSTWIGPTDEVVIYSICPLALT